jgi:UDP-N-acetylmuramate dehydrogenase
MEVLLPGREKLTILRNAILDIRKKKSMVIDPKDKNSVSCGSFFLNPILNKEEFRKFLKNCKRLELRFPAFDDSRGTKLSAAWLIENSGFKKGYKKGNVGISKNHSLALVNLGEGTTAELLELADEIKDRVEEQFLVELHNEPVIV